MTFHFPIFQLGIEGLVKLLPSEGKRKLLAATLFTTLGFGLGQFVQLFQRIIIKCDLAADVVAVFHFYPRAKM